MWRGLVVVVSTRGGGVIHKHPLTFNYFILHLANMSLLRLPPVSYYLHSSNIKSVKLQAEAHISYHLVGKSTVEDVIA
jgi:hypothetical protein